MPDTVPGLLRGGLDMFILQAVAIFVGRLVETARQSLRVQYCCPFISNPV